MQSIDRYMARLIAVPLLANLIIAAMLLVLDRMRILLDFVAAEGGPVSVVWRMLANLLPEYMGLGIPIGLLLGTLLAFRRLATSSELDVMRGVGMSYVRLLKMPYAFAIGLALVNFAIVGFLQPWSRYNYEALRFDLRSGALGASVKVGEFVKFPSGMTVRIEESRENGEKLSGIFAQMPQKDGGWVAVTAERGQFMASDDPDEILFRLTNGTLVLNEPGFTEPRVLSFSSHTLPIPLPKTENFRPRGGRNLERTIPQLIALGTDPHSSRKDQLESLANLHFRLVEVATIFLLPLLALALGVPPKRSSSALGVFLSIVMIVTYHKINEYAEGAGAGGRIDPVLALWGPFVLFAALVGWMFYTVAFVPGGQPIGALERFFAKAVGALGRLMPVRRRPAR